MKSKLFFLIPSLIIAVWQAGDIGGMWLEVFLQVIWIIFLTYWFTAPALFLREEKMRIIIPAYIGWVILSLFLVRLDSPDGVGIPHS